MNDSTMARRTQVNEKLHLRGVHCRIVKECEYVYRDYIGHVIFVKVRYRWQHLSTCDGTGGCRGRDKTFGYYYHSERGSKIKQKPPYANHYLYHLEEIDPALASHSPSPIYWCEGEKDADAVRSVGGMGTSHHQGAGKVTLEQAQCLYHGAPRHPGLHGPGRSYNARWIILVADLDDAGAFDVLLRHNLLVEEGFQGRLDIVRAAAGKDAADHIAAGYSLAQFVPADMIKLRDAAERYKSDLAENTSRYMDGGEE
jgi:hypothetical protein